MYVLSVHAWMRVYVHVCVCVLYMLMPMYVYAGVCALREVR